MVKDILTAFLLILFGMLGKIIEWFGGSLKYQSLLYEMGISLMLLTLCIWAVTEVRGDRVYIWLGLLILSSMNPINLLFMDLKLSIVHALICYVISAWIVFLYRKYK